LRKDVAAIITWFLFYVQVPPKHINPWHCMLSWIKL
jgi:hypothetical protein